MKNVKRITVTALSILITACGGGGGGDTITAPPPDDGGDDTGGIIRSGVAAGPITNFGSVIVNGVRFDTANAVVMVDDEPGSESDLAVGQFVVVKGEIEDDLINGSATEVTFDDNVEGPVESIDILGNTIVVLGQTVFVNASTSIDDSIVPASLDGLSVGNIVEVSGLVDSNGSISATRIELKPAGSEFEVHGIVANLDTGAMTFSLSALSVDYSSATLDNFPGGQISDGDFVEAKGNALGVNGELIATRVEAEQNTITGNDGDRVEVEGFITRFSSESDFDVSGVPVTTNASTTFEGGVAADLGLNVKVEVEGDFDSTGTIVATKVDIRRAKVVRMTANADSVDAANNSLVILDITVNVDDLTRLEDKSNADVDPLNLSDINAGDYLEIRGTEIPAGSGQVLAAIFEREDPDTEAELQGFVTAVNDPSITILGVSIETSAATIFRDIDNTIISASDFFANVAVNSLVKATGTETASNVITALEVEFELEN